MSAKKIDKIYKKYWNIRVTPAGLRNGSSNLPDGSVPKDLAQSQTHQHYSKIPKLVLTLRKNETKPLKNIKTLDKTPARLKNRSSNLPKGRVPKGPAQSETYQHY